jgi:hypothetical protein
MVGQAAKPPLQHMGLAMFGMKFEHRGQGKFGMNVADPANGVKVRAAPEYTGVAGLA